MPPAKRRKLELENYWSSQNNFMSDVVVKKSRLQLEKEAAIKAQIEEKENELRRDVKKGVIIKFDSIADVVAVAGNITNTQPTPYGRQSKSPPKRVVTV